MRLIIPIVFLALPGCPGGADDALDAHARLDGSAPLDVVGDVDAPQAADAGADRGPACSASGVPASCDPLRGSGCSEGVCYMVGQGGTACVCPPGTAGESASCDTTMACAGRMVCVGKQAPGVCRRICYAAAPTCADAGTCQEISDSPAFGYCWPPRPPDGG